MFHVAAKLEIRKEKLESAKAKGGPAFRQAAAGLTAWQAEDREK
jgi:hypothetical protein